MTNFFANVFLIVTLMYQVTAHAGDKIIDLNAKNNQALGASFTLVSPIKAKTNITAETILHSYLSGNDTPLVEDYLTFGLNSQAVWLVGEVNNSGRLSLEKRISIETSWLDDVAIYIFQHKKLIGQFQLGDSHPFSKKEIATRYLDVDYQFPAGHSHIVIRANTPDPLVLPIFIRAPQDQMHSMQNEGYRYGFIYGAIIALMLYNLFLALKLKQPENLYYSIYMFAFLLMNFAYTGHGFMHIWPESVVFQKWSNPIFMSFHVVTGLIFTHAFLLLSTHFKTLSRAITVAIGVVITTITLSIIFDSHAVAIFLAFLYMLLYTFAVMFIGILAVKRKLPAAPYFVSATIMGVGGASITCITVWGLIPYSAYAYMAIDFGMVLEAVLLSLALAYKFNLLLVDKLAAEELAKIDPLTELFNRRGFYESSEQVIEYSQLANKEIAVILFDLDDFKKVNDKFGHDVGDIVLQRVAATLKNSTKRQDVLARWGGEEFIILLGKTNLHQAVLIAERYRAAIEDINMVFDDQEIKLTASIGVSAGTYEKTKLTELSSLIKEADGYLYNAKHSGKNQIYSASVSSFDGKN